jgi:hypothetical protein
VALKSGKIYVLFSIIVCVYLFLTEIYLHANFLEEFRGTGRQLVLV